MRPARERVSSALDVIRKRSAAGADGDGKQAKVPRQAKEKESGWKLTPALFVKALVTVPTPGPSTRRPDREASARPAVLAPADAAGVLAEPLPHKATELLRDLNLEDAKPEQIESAIDADMARDVKARLTAAEDKVAVAQLRVMWNVSEIARVLYQWTRAKIRENPMTLDGKARKRLPPAEFPRRREFAARLLPEHFLTADMLNKITEWGELCECFPITEAFAAAADADPKLALTSIHWVRENVYGVIHELLSLNTSQKDDLSRFAPSKPLQLAFPLEGERQVPCGRRTAMQ